MEVKPKAIVLIGAPGCGKSTWAKNHTELWGSVRISTDELRAKFGTGEEDQSVSAKAFLAAGLAMEIALAKKQDVIIDATNMYPGRRKQWLDIAKKYDAFTEAFVFEVPRDVLVQRNIDRQAAGGRNVGEAVIDMMLSKYVRPLPNEFDSVTFISKMELYDDGVQSSVLVGGEGTGPAAGVR
jgi:predicted kinase